MNIPGMGKIISSPNDAKSGRTTKELAGSHLCHVGARRLSCRQSAKLFAIQIEVIVSFFIKYNCDNSMDSLRFGKFLNFLRSSGRSY